jgi:serine/threonine-protein kinase
VGPYEVIAVLGVGGMGEVYRGRDVRLGRDVALKVIASDKTQDASSLRRFEEEARAASILSHPNIVTIYGVGEEGAATYIAMELVPGHTLHQLRDHRAIGWVEALDIAAQVADALTTAHAAGIIHRDLKPDNVMLTPAGQVKVLDFGLARRDARAAPPEHDVTRAAMTLDGVILGTVGYMSPEQAAGRTAGPAADQFALGVMLYEMLAGRRAFERGTAVETLSAIICDHPAPIQLPHGAVPAPLQQLLDRCLAKDPRDRYATIGEVAARIREVRADLADAEPHSVASAPVHDTRVAGAMTRRRAMAIGAGAVAAAAAGVAAWRLRPHDTGVRSIAVLPFVNTANDADIEYLCDGITESLIRRVSLLPSLRVMARSTVFNLKGRPLDPREAGRRLNVDSIVTGTVTRRAGRLVVTAELVEVGSGAQLWGARYDRAATDLLLMQDGIATAIVDDGIRLRLDPEDRRRLARRPTDDAEAFELYLRARHAMLSDTEQDYVDARALLQKAVARDPKFVLAYVALATTYGLLAVDGFVRPTEAWPEASRHTRRTLELEPESPEAHAEKASEAFFFKWDWADAEAEWQHITRRSPAVVDTDLLRPYALMCWALGRPEQALGVVRRAREIDPLSIALRVNEADYLMYAGKPADAVGEYEKIIHDEPRDPRAFFGLADARRAERRFDEAIETRRRAHAVAEDTSLDDVLARAQGEGGYARVEAAASRLQLETLANRAASGAYVSPLDFGRAYASIGDKTRAFSYFEAAFADRAPGLVFLNVDRAWDPVRDDPQLAAAARRVGLPVVTSSV